MEEENDGSIRKRIRLGAWRSLRFSACGSDRRVHLCNPDSRNESMDGYRARLAMAVDGRAVRCAADLDLSRIPHLLARHDEVDVRK